jgi:hypothetical protein
VDSTNPNTNYAYAECTVKTTPQIERGFVQWEPPVHPGGLRFIMAETAVSFQHATSVGTNSLLIYPILSAFDIQALTWNSQSVTVGAALTLLTVQTHSPAEVMWQSGRLADGFGYLLRPADPTPVIPLPEALSGRTIYGLRVQWSDETTEDWLVHAKLLSIIVYDDDVYDGAAPGVWLV